MAPDGTDRSRSGIMLHPPPVELLVAAVLQGALWLRGFHGSRQRRLVILGWQTLFMSLLVGFVRVIRFGAQVDQS